MQTKAILEFIYPDDEDALLFAKALASSLELNPHALSASFNLVGLPDLDNKDPFIPPNLAAKETRLGLVPDFIGAFKFSYFIIY